VTKKAMLFTSVAFLTAWLGAPETRAGSWTNLGSGLDSGWAASLVFDTNGNLFVGGGWFTNAGGVAATNIAKWNGTAWTNLGNGIGNPDVKDLAFDTNGNLYAGGDFTTAGGVAAANIAKWNGTAWTNLGNGVNNIVSALARDTTSNLYAGGWFTTAGGMPANYIAKWNGSAWVTSLFSLIGMGDLVDSLALDTNGNLYAGGFFTNAGGVAANRIAKWDGTAWTNLGSGLDSGWAASLVFDTNGNLFAGGNFTNAGGMAANYIAKWNGTAWTNLGSGMNNFVYALALDPNGNLYAGGAFTNAGGVAANYIAKWNGTAWTNLGSGMNGVVYTLARDTNGNLYAGGFFTTAGGVAANRVAKWTMGIGFVSAALNYACTNGGANPSNQTFVVTNDGLSAFNFTNTVSFSANSSTNTWFTPSVTTGLVPAAGSLAVTGSVNITNLSEGIYYATNTFSAPEAANSPQTLVVTLRVMNAARLWVSPTNFSKELTEGQGAVFDEIKVANTGAPPRGAMAYTVTTPDTWLSVSPTNGNAQDGTNTVTLGCSATNLSAGWYTGRVDVAAQGEGVGTQSVYVVLRVNHRPMVAWNASSTVWTNEIILGGSLGATTAAVWNASGAPTAQMSYQVYVLNDSFGWVSVSNASGVSTGDQKTVTVSYTTTGLVAGVYTAQLMVAGADVATGEAATNGPLRVGLTLTVRGSLPVLKTDVTSLSQTVLENYVGTNSFSVWNEGGLPRGGMRYTVTPEASWITVSPATGAVTNNVNSVRVVSGTTGTTLPPGVYHGNLVVDAFDAHAGTRATGAPLSIPLTLTVTSRTPTNRELPAVVGTLFIGQTVTLNVGLWQNQERLTYSYQWERAANKVGGGREVLSGEVRTNYVISEATRGKFLRVDVTATDSEPFPLSSTAYSTWVDSAKVKALRADFNGDGITDLWFYDELTGTWRASFGTSSSAAGIFGGQGMTAVPGDYDGDGYEDLGVYESAHGIWQICFLPRGDYASGSLFGGTVEEATATPVPADYDGDGATDLALYWMGYWAIRYSSLGSLSLVGPFASVSGAPVTGDWDGNGITELGVYEDGAWTLRMSTGSLVTYEFGGTSAGIVPTLGDFDGDGITDIGVYDTAANQWRWRKSSTGLEQSVNFGQGGIVPIPGYYDHDRQEDWVQARLSADTDIIVWEVKRTTETNFLYRGQSYQQSIDRWRVSW